MINTAIPPSTINIKCQFQASVTYPPIVGATMGDAPNINISKANILALSFNGNISRTIVMEATPAAQLPNACINRNQMSVCISAAKKQPMDATMYKTNPAYKGFLRPNLSSNGPYNNCPADIPIKKLDKDKETCAVVVFNDLAIAGKPGRYISIEKGPNAVSAPNIKTVKKYLCLVIKSNILVSGQRSFFAGNHLFI